MHYSLAINLLVPEEYRQKLPGLVKSYPKQENSENDDLVRMGLLMRTETDHRYQFIHRSFVEFFLSEYLIENFQNENVQTFLFEEIFCGKHYEVIREFFNDRLKIKKGQAPLSSNAFELTAKGEILFAKMLCWKQSKFFVNNINWSQINYEILNFFRQFFKANKTNEQYKRIIEEALYYSIIKAIRRFRDDMVEQIMEFSSEFDDTFYKQKILGTHEEDIKRRFFKMRVRNGDVREHRLPMICGAYYHNMRAIKVIMKEIARLDNNSSDEISIIEIFLKYEFLPAP